MATRSWAPPVPMVWLGAVLALLAGTLTVLATLGITLESAILPPGRLLLGVAAVVLAGLAGHGALVRPRLAADRDGVTVRGIGGARSWPWHSLRYEVRYRSRFGRKLTTLELDGIDSTGAEHLAVLGKLDLGADPLDVLAELDALRRSATS